MLDKASHGPLPAGIPKHTVSNKAASRRRRVVARTRATTPTQPTPDPAESPPTAVTSEGQADEAAVAEVVPLPVFNAREEAARWR